MIVVSTGHFLFLFFVFVRDFSVFGNQPHFWDKAVVSALFQSTDQSNVRPRFHRLADVGAQCVFFCPLASSFL